MENTKPPENSENLTLKEENTPAEMHLKSQQDSLNGASLLAVPELHTPSALTETVNQTFTHFDAERQIDKTPPLTQAERVFKKFGSALTLYKALEAVGKRRNKATIFKWKYSREHGGTDGRIPTRVWPDIFLAAEYMGITISSEDLDPRVFPLSANATASEKIETPSSLASASKNILSENNTADDKHNPTE